jgi:hypothetical protein
VIACGKFIWDALSHISTFETLPEDLQRFKVDWIQPACAFLWNQAGWLLPVFGVSIIVAAHVTDRLWDRITPWFSSAKPRNKLSHYGDAPFDMFEGHFESFLQLKVMPTKTDEELCGVMKTEQFGVMPSVIESLFGKTERNTFMKRMTSIKDELEAAKIADIGMQLLRRAHEYVISLQIKTYEQTEKKLEERYRRDAGTSNTLTSVSADAADASHSKSDSLQPTAIDALTGRIKSADSVKSPDQFGRWRDDTRSMLLSMLSGGREYGKEFYERAPENPVPKKEVKACVGRCREYLRGLIIKLSQSGPNAPISAHSTDLESSEKSDRSSPSVN